MSKLVLVSLAFAAPLLVLPPVLADDATVRVGEGELQTSAALAEWIDGRYDALRREAGLESPEIVDDATFLRRAFLDLVGRTPSVARTRDFLADDYPYKRAALVEAILGGEVSPYTDRRTRERSASHMARVWRRVLVPSSNPQAARAVQLEPWLKQQFEDRVPYDELVRAILLAGTAPAEADPAGGGPIMAGPALLPQILGNTPDALADNYTRVFLGVRLGCAKCHDHPFADWKQADFWGMAAFYGDGSGEIQSSENGTTYPVKYLAGEAIELDGETSSRQLLADWLTAPENPNFAATAVNRVWQQLLGRPLAGEVDDLDLVSEAERAALLDGLAARFAASGYDLRWLVEGICKSRVYQQTVTAEGGPGGPLAGRTLKTLTPEQVFDAMEQALSLPVTNNEGSPRYNGQRAAFVQRLDESYADAPDRFEGGIPQALMLMHGDLVADATGLDSSRTLRAVVEAPFLSRAQKVEALYLAAYTRKPSKKESERLVEYVERQSGEQAQRSAYAEIFWALLNSPEFVLSR